MEKVVDNLISAAEETTSRAGRDEDRRREEPRLAHPGEKPKRFAALVFVFYLCVFVLLSGGRMSSGDGGSQLQAALTLVNTGSLGTYDPPKEWDGQVRIWVKNPHGVYYQAHDIGNVALMLPAAALGSLTSKASPQTKIDNPSLVSKFGGAMTICVVTALGCLFMFKLFALFYPQRTAFLLSLAFATTTIISAYAKTAYDVSGAATSMAILLYLSARILTERRVALSTAVLLGGALALVSSFRYSMAPMLVIGAAGVLTFARPRITRAHVLACAPAFLAGMTPTLIYNYVRMGSPFIPATAHPAFVAYGTADLSGNILAGLYGLTVSPNRGLLWFAPILLLLFWLPSLWKRLEPSAQQLILCYGVSSLLYTLLIAKIRFWGAFGYGPRYMVPILPLLFFGTATVLMRLWDTHKKPLMALLALSALLNLPPLLVNWHLVTQRYPGANAMYALKPNQQMGMWHGLFLGLQGKPLPAPPDVLNDPIRITGTRFPDLWTFRVMEHSSKGLAMGLICFLALLGGTAVCFRRLTAQNEGRPACP